MIKNVKKYHSWLRVWCESKYHKLMKAKILNGTFEEILNNRHRDISSKISIPRGKTSKEYDNGQTAANQTNWKLASYPCRPIKRHRSSYRAPVQFQSTSGDLHLVFRNTTTRNSLGKPCDRTTPLADTDGATDRK